MYSRQTPVPEPEPLIPRNIIQTYKAYSEKTTNASRFKTLNPHHRYYFFNDSEAESFVRRHMPPNIVRAYEKMPVPVLKSDYFRYIATYILGGVYSDYDTECRRPIDTWADNHTGIGFMAGIEAESKMWRRDFVRPLQLTQWTFASRPHHPILKRIIDQIAIKTEHMIKKNISIPVVLEWTGPGLWTDTIFDYMNETYHVEWPTLRKLEENRKIGDIYLLQITAFQAQATYMGGKGINHTEARTLHGYWGSWKKGLANI